MAFFVLQAGQLTLAQLRHFHQSIAAHYVG